MECHQFLCHIPYHEDRKLIGFQRRAIVLIDLVVCAHVQERLVLGEGDHFDPLVPQARVIQGDDDLIALLNPSASFDDVASDLFDVHQTGSEGRVCYGQVITEDVDVEGLRCHVLIQQRSEGEIKTLCFLHMRIGERQPLVMEAVRSPRGDEQVVMPINARNIVVTTDRRTQGRMMIGHCDTIALVESLWRTATFVYPWCHTDLQSCHGHLHTHIQQSIKEQIRSIISTLGSGKLIPFRCPLEIFIVGRVNRDPGHYIAWIER